MKFQEKDINKLKYKENVYIIKEILKKLCDVRISNYTGAYLAASFSFPVLDTKQMILNELFCLGNILSFLINEVNILANDEILCMFDVDEYIKSTDDYKKLNNLYDEYVAEIAKLIDQFENLDIYDIGVLYTILLKNGFLSKNKSFEFKKIHDNDQRLLDIRGARITSGFGVCRHMAHNLTDVYNKLNYKSEYLICKTGLDESILKKYPTLFSNFKNISHAIVGVENDNEYLIIDPTWETIGILSRKNNNIIELRKFWDDSNNYLYTDLNRYNEEYAVKIANMPCYLDSISSIQTKEKIERMKLIFEGYKGNFEKWNSLYNELFEEISELEKILSGYKDSDFVQEKRRKFIPLKKS